MKSNPHPAHPTVYLSNHEIGIDKKNEYKFLLNNYIPIHAILTRQRAYAPAKQLTGIHSSTNPIKSKSHCIPIHLTVLRDFILQMQRPIMLQIKVVHSYGAQVPSHLKLLKAAFSILQNTHWRNLIICKTHYFQRFPRNIINVEGFHLLKNYSAVIKPLFP